MPAVTLRNQLINGPVQRLSSSSRWVRLIIPPLLTILYLGALANYAKVLTETERVAAGTSFEDLVGMLAFPLGIWVVYRWLDNSFATAYDSRFLYLYKKSGNEQISLVDIYMIKHTMMQVNQRYYWKICYHDANGLAQSVRIRPIFTGLSASSIIGFQAAVEQRNPRVEILNQSYSFDFDQ